MKKILFFSLMIIGLGMTSCGDDSGPTVDITSPSDGDSFSAGSTITVAGIATDDTGITDLTVTVSQDGQNSLNESLDLAGVDATNIPFELTLTIDATTPEGEYELTITATDEDGNVEDDSVKYNISQ